MRAPPDLHCPLCARPLQPKGERLSCAPCLAEYSTLHGAFDLRIPRAPIEANDAPEPLARGDMAPALARLEGGADYRETLEHLLRYLPIERADRLMQLIRESRGAWFPFLGPARGRALVVGNALSGTAVPLALSGFEVTHLDPSPERLRFAWARGEDAAPGRFTFVLAGSGPRLPFSDRAFDVVVQEGGLPGPATGWGHDLAECRRVCRRDLVLTADNRLGYKRALGRRGEFHVPSPIEYARGVHHPRAGEMTLFGYRRILAGFETLRAFALYPHALDFAQIVGLDGDGPKLWVGPKERKNRLKICGRALGLFPVLTPSFAFVCRRGRRGPNRLERALEHIARHVGEPTPVVDQVIATRGGGAVVLTAPADARESGGRFAVHVPLGAKPIERRLHHSAFLAHVRAHHPQHPVPGPLFEGVVEGMTLTCERRLGGLGAAQWSGEPARIGPMIEETAGRLAKLVVEPARPMTPEVFEELVGAKFDLVSRYASVPSSLTRLSRMRNEAAERLIGRPLPRVLYHADLRSKHVHIDDEGTVLGYLDWGSAEESDLPCYDLLHLIAHERKQECGLPASEAWEVLRRPAEWRPYERRALEGYAASLHLDEDVFRALVEIYPVLVAAVAEKNWDYSRPHWLHRQFAL